MHEKENGVSIDIDRVDEAVVSKATGCCDT
jgi:hypothetical protein